MRWPRPGRGGGDTAKPWLYVVAAAELMAYLVCLNDHPEAVLDALEFELLLAVLSEGDDQVISV